MKVFDFDNTIYNGESSFDFALFMVKKKKSLIKYLPNFLYLLVLYKLCLLSPDDFVKRLEKFMGVFMENKEFTLKCIKEFWLLNIEKLYPHMLKKITPNDVISTACPSFLIEEIKDVLNTDHILDTKIDIETGKITMLNFQKNKVETFKEVFPKAKVKSFYTDSYNDKPFMEISENVYLVKKGKCKKIK